MKHPRYLTYYIEFFFLSIDLYLSDNRLPIIAVYDQFSSC